jgi:hypothetical protein
MATIETLPVSDNLIPVIDDLGKLKAQIADLEKQEKALKAQLEHLEPGAYEGRLFRVSISVSDRETLDMEAVREKLTPQFIRAHTNVTTVRALRVVARK